MYFVSLALAAAAVPLLWGFSVELQASLSSGIPLAIQLLVSKKLRNQVWCQMRPPGFLYIKGGQCPFHGSCLVSCLPCLCNGDCGQISARMNILEYPRIIEISVKIWCSLTKRLLNTHLLKSSLVLEGGSFKNHQELFLNKEELIEKGFSAFTEEFYHHKGANNR